MAQESLKVLYVTAEAYPFAKMGGLGDVGAALPKALARLGHQVRLVLPAYPWVERGHVALSLDIPMRPAAERVQLYEQGLHRGVRVYAVGNETYFDRDLIYGYPDDDARFVLFSKAAVTFAALSGWTPDIIHCNDWHTGLVAQYARVGPYQAGLDRTAAVLTIHNLAYQGPFGPRTAELIGLDDGFEGNLLARGIAFADAVTTVSRGYRKEILTEKYGVGLDSLLRSRQEDLHGILNGVDYEEFDPRVDAHIAAQYDESSPEGKRRNKAVLQHRSGLALNPDVPLLGMVARLVDQKGLDLLCLGLDRIVALGAQVVVMGVGDEHHRRALEEAAARHPGTVAYHATDEEALARLVYAGSDFFLAPSAFEPCGLGPLIALRYGSIPIVRRTGGLAETIVDYAREPETGLGFTFIRKYPGHLVKTVETALEVYQRKDEWRSLQRRAMAADFSWERSSQEIEQLYRQTIAKCRAASQSVTFRASSAIYQLKARGRRRTAPRRSK